MTGDSAFHTVRVDFDLDVHVDPHLADAGARSLLFAIGNSPYFGGSFVSSGDAAADNERSRHDAIVRLWAVDGASPLFVEGARFRLWYGGDAGTGVVTAVL